MSKLNFLAWLLFSPLLAGAIAWLWQTVYEGLPPQGK